MVRCLSTTLALLLAWTAAGGIRTASAWFPSSGPSGFIRVYNNSFVDDNCLDFLPMGWNTWNSPQLEDAIEVVKNGANSWLAQQFDAEFQQAKSANFNIMRLFGVGAEGVTKLQISKGVFDETVFRAFDYILYKAGQYNIKVIWAFINNWQVSEGPTDYTQNWNGVQWVDQFWTDANAKLTYKNYVYTVLNRVNVFTNRQYKNDPTIFAWDLFNELRCPQNQNPTSVDQINWCMDVVTAWGAEMAQYVKSLDSNHMLTWGMEGFFVYNSRYVDSNPWGTPSNVNPGWAGSIGQDFWRHHNVWGIDFAAIHLWPDNWATLNTDWVWWWMWDHVWASAAIGRPLLIEEYGKTSSYSTVQERDPYFLKILQFQQQQIEMKGWLRGNLFWMWDPLNTNFVGPDTVKTGDSTFQLLSNYAYWMAEQSGSVVPGCSPSYSG